jgi:hypothetical protein
LDLLLRLLCGTRSVIAEVARVHPKLPRRALDACVLIAKEVVLTTSGVRHVFEILGAIPEVLLELRPPFGLHLRLKVVQVRG